MLLSSLHMKSAFMGCFGKPPPFTVEENIMAAQNLHPHSNVLQIYFNTPTYRKNEEEARQSTRDIMEMLNSHEGDANTSIKAQKMMQSLIDPDTEKEASDEECSMLPNPIRPT